MSKSIEDYVVRTGSFETEGGFRFTHPLNPNSQIEMRPLSRPAGMERVQLTLARVPAGKESFLAHAHTVEEEFIFILEGEGLLRIDGETTMVRSGDYVGFPADGAVHHLSNPGTGDLVYLMGGESLKADVARFPDIGKVGYWANGTMTYVDEEAGQRFVPADFVASKE